MLLTLNVGSSSIKYAVFETVATLPERPSNLKRLARGNLALNDMDDIAPAIEQLRATLSEQLSGFMPDVIVHRLVHGGQTFSAPIVISESTLAQLTALIPLAPLHLPAEVEALTVCARHFVDVTQMACFDTAFHQSQSSLAKQYALPRALTQEGIVRYGFHGLSYDYIARALPDYLQESDQQRVIVAHLGNGASLCALRNGKSIATTTGFSTLDGLMMGSRCGHLDPGILLYLGQQKQWSWGQIERLLYQESGLLGVSGISNDVWHLLNDPSKEAKEALQLFCAMAAREAGSLIMALGGLDTLVFTGGIGEHSPSIRAGIAEYFQWLGLTIGKQAVDEKSPYARPLHSEQSQVKVWVIPTDEERMLAWYGVQLLFSSQKNRI